MRSPCCMSARAADGLAFDSNSHAAAYTQSPGSVGCTCGSSKTYVIGTIGVGISSSGSACICSTISANTTQASTVMYTASWRLQEIIQSRGGVPAEHDPRLCPACGCCCWRGKTPATLSIGRHQSGSAAQHAQTQSGCAARSHSLRSSFSDLWVGNRDIRDIMHRSQAQLLCD